MAGFDEWAVIELFGHQRVAGKVTEQQIGGASFVRVDVPALVGGDDTCAPITKYYNPSAIYSIAPCTEEVARMVAERCRPQPVDRYDVMDEINRLRKRGALPGQQQPEEEEDLPV